MYFIKLLLSQDERDQLLKKEILNQYYLRNKNNKDEEYLFNILFKKLKMVKIS